MAPTTEKEISKKEEEKVELTEKEEEEEDEKDLDKPDDTKTSYIVSIKKGPTLEEWRSLKKHIKDQNSKIVRIMGSRTSVIGPSILIQFQDDSITTLENDDDERIVAIEADGPVHTTSKKPVKLADKK